LKKNARRREELKELAQEGEPTYGPGEERRRSCSIRQRLVERSGWGPEKESYATFGFAEVLGVLEKTLGRGNEAKKTQPNQPKETEPTKRESLQAEGETDSTM